MIKNLKMDKKSGMQLLVLIIIASVSFYGGMKYSSGKSSQSGSQFTNGQRMGVGGSNTSRGGRMGGGFINGEVISKDDKTITIKSRDGSSKIVFYSQSTTLTKGMPVQITELNTGDNVMVNGTQNSDGSVTASNVQIRPKSTAPLGTN